MEKNAANHGRDQPAQSSSLPLQILSLLTFTKLNVHGQTNPKAFETYFNREGTDQQKRARMEGAHGQETHLAPARPPTKQRLLRRPTTNP